MNQKKIDEILSNAEQYQAYPVQGKVIDEDIVHLTGLVKDWQMVIDFGHLVGKLQGVRGVINDLKFEGQEKPKEEAPKTVPNKKMETDILIVGGGVIGCGIARELSRYNKKIVIVEKNTDVAEGTSKANNGMIHSGFDSPTGSVKAKMNVKGNALYSKWKEELGFHMVRSGSFVVGFDEDDHAYLQDYFDRGTANGVPGIELLTGDQARAIEKNLHHDVIEALWTPSAGYVEPYEVTEALAENAIVNGADLMLDTEVVAIEATSSAGFIVSTTKGRIYTKVLVNAAGLFADKIAQWAGDRFYTIHPRQGTLLIFDRKKRGTMERFIGTPPRNFTKGGGPMETPEGNPLWGPSAQEIQNKEDFSCTRDAFSFVMDKGRHLAEGVQPSDMITFFAGNRAATMTEDFIIENSRKVKGLVHVAGIQSPGLASAPAIAEEVVGLVKEQLPDMEESGTFQPIRKEKKRFRDLSRDQQEAWIKENPLHGRIICRCETITEGEIVDAIHGVVPATTLDAVKRRTRSGMGRCQGGFCGPRVQEIIARELGISINDITKKGPGSEITIGNSRPMEEAQDE
jgi:glycerol-3-phosphate dehydrogenase